jgi:hypothetical protein
MLLALLPRVIKAAKSTCVACLLELSGGRVPLIGYFGCIILRKIGVLALLKLFAF